MWDEQWYPVKCDGVAKSVVMDSDKDDGRTLWVTVLTEFKEQNNSKHVDRTLFFQAKTQIRVSGNLQDTWLEDYKPEEHTCWFASSPNGWTSDELGLSWLQILFDPQTPDKAKRDWISPMLDSNGSHGTLGFLGWCHKRRILVAIYPSHSTQRLQPLDVSLFDPLASCYS
jgi:hypothetical protein